MSYNHPEPELKLSYPEPKLSYITPAPGVEIDPFTYAIDQSLNSDENSLVCFVGNPRRGKSNGGKVVGELIDANGRMEYPQNGEKPIPHFYDPATGKVYRPCFNAKHIGFLPRDYIGLIRKGKKGDFTLFDEPGGELSSRRSSSFWNVLISSVIITFGSLLINTGWAVPILPQQDVNIARMMKWLFTFTSRGPKGFARIYKGWVNHRTGERGQEQIGYCLFAQAFQGRPEEEKEYQENKKQYQDKKYEKDYLEFEEEEKNKTTESNIEYVVQEVLKDPTEFLGKRGAIQLHILIQRFHIQYKAGIEVKRKIELALAKKSVN